METFRIILSLNTFWLSVVILVASAQVGIAKECETPWAGKLLVSEGVKIAIYDKDFNNEEVLLDSPFPFSVEYDPYENIVFWSDLNTREIKGYRGETQLELRSAFQPSNWMPADLALDYISHKLYVLDTASSSVHLFDLLNSNHAIIIGTNVTEAKQIEVDPQNGYLFVLDKYRIFRTELDGGNRKVVLSHLKSADDLVGELAISGEDDADSSSQRSYKQPMTVSDITLDFASKRMYWVDSVTRCVESTDYNGENRKFHYHNNPNPVGFESLASITLLDGYLYWADGLEKNVVKIDLSTTNKGEKISKYPFDIKSITCPAEKIENPCEENNGGCQHLCVLSKSSEKNFKCVCNLGYKLNVADNTCAPVQDFLLYSVVGYLRGQIIDTPAKSFLDTLNPSTFSVGVSASLDYDGKENKIFFSSLYPNDKIHQISLDTNEVVELVPDLISNNTGAFAFDWITKNLYYFTYYYADMTTLSVMNVADPTYSKILVNDVKDLVRGIVVHPNKGWVFFAQINGNSDTISRINTDGSSQSVLIKTGTHFSVDALAVDDTEDRLYWTESTRQPENTYTVRIRHANLNGEDIQDLVVPPNLERVDSIVIDENWIYLITGPNNAIVRFSKGGSESATTLFDQVADGSLSGLQVFSRDNQRVDPHNPCTENNNCEKFCFAVPNANGQLQRACGCPYGEKLAKDGKSCEDNSREEPPFVPCKSLSYKCKRPRGGRRIFNFNS